MPGSMIERVAGWLEREGEKRLECARRLREEAPRWRKRGRPGREAHRVHAEREVREAAERERELNIPIAKPNEPPDTRSECRRWVEERLGRPLE